MSSQEKTITFLAEQVSSAGDISYRKMFGEYALYCDGKVVAFICDDQLFVKPTINGRTFIGDVIEKPAYPGSKNYFWISGDLWDDEQWLSELVAITAKEVPFAKRKK